MDAQGVVAGAAPNVQQAWDAHHDDEVVARAGVDRRLRGVAGANDPDGVVAGAGGEIHVAHVRLGVVDRRRGKTADPVETGKAFEVERHVPAHLADREVLYVTEHLRKGMTYTGITMPVPREVTWVIEEKMVIAQPELEAWLAGHGTWTAGAHTPWTWVYVRTSAGSR